MGYYEYDVKDGIHLNLKSNPPWNDIKTVSIQLKL